MLLAAFQARADLTIRAYNKGDETTRQQRFVTSTVGDLPADELADAARYFGDRLLHIRDGFRRKYGEIEGKAHFARELRAIGQAERLEEYWSLSSNAADDPSKRSLFASGYTRAMHSAATLQAAAQPDNPFKLSNALGFKKEKFPSFAGVANGAPATQEQLDEALKAYVDLMRDYGLNPLTNVREGSPLWRYLTHPDTVARIERVQADAARRDARNGVLKGAAISAAALVGALIGLDEALIIGGSVSYAALDPEALKHVVDSYKRSDDIRAAEMIGATSADAVAAADREKYFATVLHGAGTLAAGYMGLRGALASATVTKPLTITFAGAARGLGKEVAFNLAMVGAPAAGYAAYVVDPRTGFRQRVKLFRDSMLKEGTLIQLAGGVAVGAAVRGVAFTRVYLNQKRLPNGEFLDAIEGRAADGSPTTLYLRAMAGSDRKYVVVDANGNPTVRDPHGNIVTIDAKDDVVHAVPAPSEPTTTNQLHGLDAIEPDLARPRRSLRANDVRSDEGARDLLARAVHDTRMELAREAQPYASMRDQPFAACSVLGACGFGREVSGASLKNMGVSPENISYHQAATAFGGSRHAFLVVDVHGKKYIVDTTLRQFFQPGNKVGEAFAATPQGRALAGRLLRDGYAELTDKSAAIYGNAMRAGEGREPTAIGVRDLRASTDRPDVSAELAPTLARVSREPQHSNNWTDLYPEQPSGTHVERGPNPQPTRKLGFIKAQVDRAFAVVPEKVRRFLPREVMEKMLYGQRTDRGSTLGVIGGHSREILKLGGDASDDYAFEFVNRDAQGRVVLNDDGTANVRFVSTMDAPNRGAPATTNTKRSTIANVSDEDFARATYRIGESGRTFERVVDGKKHTIRVGYVEAGGHKMKWIVVRDHQGNYTASYPLGSMLDDTTRGYFAPGARDASGEIKPIPEVHLDSAPATTATPRFADADRELASLYGNRPREWFDRKARAEVESAFRSSNMEPPQGSQPHQPLFDRAVALNKGLLEPGRVTASLERLAQRVAAKGLPVNEQTLLAELQQHEYRQAGWQGMGVVDRSVDGDPKKFFAIAARGPFKDHLDGRHGEWTHGLFDYYLACDILGPQEARAFFADLGRLAQEHPDVANQLWLVSFDRAGTSAGVRSPDFKTRYFAPALNVGHQ